MRMLAARAGLYEMERLPHYGGTAKKICSARLPGILDQIRDPSLTMRAIAKLHGVNINSLYVLARRHEIYPKTIRPAGKQPSSPPTKAQRAMVVEKLREGLGVAATAAAVGVNQGGGVKSNKLKNCTTSATILL